MQAKWLKSIVAGAALLGILLVATPAVRASVPSNGATIQQRRQAVDQVGVPYSEDHFLGYKIFVATSPTAIQLVDETGTIATSGMIHQVCRSSGAATSDYAVLYDSNPVNASLSNLTTGNQATNEGLQISPLLNRSTSVELCDTIDAQFNNGTVVLQSANPASGTTHVYWRPSRGGSN